jgi:hypothetical protein
LLRPSKNYRGNARGSSSGAKFDVDDIDPIIGRAKFSAAEQPGAQAISDWKEADPTHTVHSKLSFLVVDSRLADRALHSSRAMSKAQDQLASLRIAAPCQASWEGMAGDERVRHCSLCSLNVYNFAEMKRDEVRELLERTEGRLCARLYRRADGTVITRDCPTGLRALRRRASRLAAAWIAVLLSLPSFAFGSSFWKKPGLRKHGSNVELKIEQAATPQAAVFGGVVRDEGGYPLPGVSIAVRDEASQCEITAVSDVNGAFTIASLNDGMYRVEMTLDGFNPARIEHLQFEAGKVTHASVALQVDPSTVLMGVIMVEPTTQNNGMSMTFTQDFINKLPL